MFVLNNKFILLCTESLSMDEKIAMVGFILYISLAFTALAESPPIDDSSPKHTLCPTNEERRCRNPCPPETCMTLYAAFRCIENQTCVNGCYCKPGFLRIGQKGPCVPRDQCNPLECVNDPNAQKGCGDKCGKSCADYKSHPICPKRPCKNDGCECKEGYIYDENLSLCVKPKDCSKPCKPHERYSTCLLSECVAKTCDDVGYSLACPAIAADPCPAGCICDYGYVKDKAGNCVDAKTCPSCGGDPNAQAGCGNPCGKICASLNANKSDLICPQYCLSYGCDCKEGYLLNTDVKPPRCVLVKDCPKPPNKCGKNEEFYCGPSCPYSEASCSHPNTPTCFKKCELKCFCKKGYVRDANNACIPVNKCPKQCLKPHETYSNCVLGECVPKTCDDLGKPLACPRIAPPCAGGCICEQGYVRDKDGNCIDAKSCPSCGGDPNAESGCSNPCGQTCANLRNNTRNKRDTFAAACATYCVMNGCDCKKGYILNTDVNPPRCVLPEDCNKHKLCPANEERRCRNPCPPETCMTLYAAFLCIQNQTCVDGCHCKPGFLRIGQKGPCVPRDQCNPLECVNDPNAQKGCGDKCGKSCADYKSHPICPKRPCKNDGCECKEGYIYDQNLSLCVKPKDCSKPCKPHERYSTCLLSECVAKTCDDVGYSLACPAIAADPCPGGCICDYGYVKDKAGNCVDAKTCPSCGGDPNAQAGCGNPCGKTCASLNANKSDLICPQYCLSYGCDCKEGYLLNTDVKPPRCVLVKDCPKPPNKCGNNEEYYCGPSCPGSEASCSNPNPPTCINKRCELKCFCKKGYVRGAKNACIPANKCPKQCPKPHERYSNCMLGECVPKTCADLGKPLPCPDIAPPCAGGCICEQGYVRDKDGNCINAKSCPSCGGDPNAESGCSNPCGQTCANLKSNTGNTSAVACAAYCVINGCDCKKGYILNTDVIPPRCVLPEDCNKPLNCTKPNERYIDCLAGQCTPKTCDDLGRSLACPFMVGPCPGGCICKEDYLRNSEGKCIKLENCPAKPCGGNQTWMSPCNVPCPYPRCPRDDKPPPPCIEIMPCYPGCQCKLNYLRNSTGHCILAPDCPPVKCTRQNEVWDGCPSSCLAESCDDVNNQPTTCNTLIWLCSPRCVCKKGHFRNKDGVCVPALECPGTKCTKPNEKYIDCLAGQCKAKTCDELVTPAPCPRVKPPCPGGCICVDGYVRNKAGDCIKKEDCPKNCTGVNEQYTDCVNDQCYPRTCKEVVKMPSCPSTKPSKCLGGCVCKRGFVRCDNGTCIAIKDCPQAGTCADPNQAWVDCAVNCANAYCPKNDQPQPICFLPAGICQPGCKCKPNYRIDKNNNCIPASECPKVPCTRPNEEYNSCPSNRITSCALLGTKPVTNTGPKICNPRCICKEGFYQNANGTCVPKSQCETVARRCPANEVLKSKVPCPPDTCDMLYVSVLCTADQTESVVCTCKDGYLRTNSTSTGVCVPQDRCLPPECADDPNAKRGCGNRCRKTCADYNDTTKVCNKNVCKLFGCECQDGFVYDDNIKKCVKPKECTKQCNGPHEKYIDCPAGQCNAKTCADLVTPPGCPRIIPPCPGGCVCEDGYLKDSKGICIKKEKCPSMQCKKPHERYSNCLLGECVPKKCDDVGYPVACPDIIDPCAGGCTCKEGFVRDCNGDCIDMKECPSCGGDQNAVSGCGNPCGKTCASVNANKSELFCPQYCEYNGCDCKPGFLLLESNNTDSKKCVPEYKCPKPSQQCGVNEQYYCGTSCPEATCANPTPPTCVNKKCKLGCFCKKGFVRDANNKCVPVDKCPPKCKGPHEIYIDCPAGQCNAKKCEDLIIAPPCPRIMPPCPGGCVCEGGYLRDSKGICIKKEQCPQSCKANQTYVTCNVNCPDKHCPKYDGPQPVCDPPRNCPPGCTCKINYKYDQAGNCILASECPPVNCTGQNTEWNSCPSACLSERCEDADSPPVVCNTLLLNCQPRCVCKKGHFRNKDGLCVPAKECPSVCKDPNASWTDCKDACPGTCQNTRPGCVNKKCSAGCQCNEGYVLSKIGGKCVKIETCADYADCCANQTFVQCTFKCPQVMCPESDQTILCKPPRDCPGGCGCKPYYRYNATGDCVKASDCPPVQCTRQNEEWTSCQRISDWERCEDRFNSPPINPGDADDCTPKCVCTKGYWRDGGNKCVTEKECPQ